MQKKRTLSEVWDVIDISVYIILGYGLLELFFSVNSYIDKIFPAGVFSILVTIFAFGTIGFIGRKDGLEQKEITRFGAYSGLIVGFFGAIIGIITFYMFPEKFTEQISAAVQAGAEPAMVQTMIKIGTFANLVLGPAINAGIGALVALISGSIFKKKFEKKR